MLRENRVWIDTGMRTAGMITKNSGVVPDDGLREEVIAVFCAAEQSFRASFDENSHVRE